LLKILLKRINNLTFKELDIDFIIDSCFSLLVGKGFDKHKRALDILEIL